jgi:hypothetical protein
MPKTEKEEPRRVIALKDSELLKDADPVALHEDPNLATPRSDKAEPRAMKSNMAIDAPRRATPRSAKDAPS